MADRLLVLAWHNVERTWYYPSAPGTGCAGLAYQLERLSKVATIVPLGPALEALSSGRSLPPRAVALTFDDGYRDNLEMAVPLLEKLGLPATFFLVPGFLGREADPWWELLAWGFARSSQTAVSWNGRVLRTRGWLSRRSVQWVCGQLRKLARARMEETIAELLRLLQPEGKANVKELFLDWSGAGELVRRGFAIGSHSMYHTTLSRELADEQVRDLIASRARLEAELDVPVRLLAYPIGTRADYSAETIDAARRAGYTHALAAHAGVNSPLTPAYSASRFVMEPHRGFSEIVARRIVGRIQGRNWVG